MWILIGKKLKHSDFFCDYLPFLYEIINDFSRLFWDVWNLYVQKIYTRD